MSINRFLFILQRFISESFTNFIALFYRADLRAAREGTYQRGVTGLLPVIGYAMAVASLADFIYYLFPLQLQNPAWELQTIGKLVEQCWGFLIALALIFSRYLLENQNDVRGIELCLLNFLRWLVLLLAILFIFSVPLIGLDTLRLHRAIRQQVSAADAAKLAQIQQIKTQLEQVSEPKRLAALAQSLGLDAQSLQGAPAPQIKSAVQERLTNLQTQIQTQIQVAQKAQSRQLFKQSFRTLYSGLIISFTFVFIWFKVGRFWANLS